MADVFISYSRKDGDFVRALQAALEARGREAWVDWEDIRPSAEWMAEIERAIEAADTVLFVISPDSLTSTVCAQELAHAVAQQKRLIPVLRREPGDLPVPERLAAHNWLFFRDGDDFDAAVVTLIEALDTDLDWVRAHTRLLTRALEWEGRGRRDSLLLRRDDLRTAEETLARAPDDREPRPVPIQREYVLAGRRSATRGQRRTTGIALAGSVVVLILAAAALLQRNAAQRNERAAERNEQLALEGEALASSRELASTALLQSGADPELSVLLALEGVAVRPTEQAEAALRQALVDSRLRVVLRGHEGFVRRAVFSPDGTLVATVGNDRTLRLWDAATGQQVGEPLLHPGILLAVAFDPSGTRVATAGSTGDGRIRIWDVATRRVLVEMPGHGLDAAGRPVWIKSVAFSPDGSRLVSGGDDNTARIWDAATGGELHVLSGHEKGVQSVAFSPDGKTVLTGSNDLTARLWDAATGRQTDTVTQPSSAAAHTTGISSVAYSRSGRFLATSGYDGRTLVWEPASRQLADEIVGHTSTVADAAFSPDETMVATASFDTSVRLWELGAAKAVRRSTNATAHLRGHTDWANSVQFSPDGRLLLTAGQDGTARIWAAVPDGGLARVPGAAELVRNARVSPDGRRVATVLQSVVTIKEVTGANPALWKPLGQLVGHRGDVRDVTFSPDGTSVLTASEDGSARLWDTTRLDPAMPGRFLQLVEFRGHAGTAQKAVGAVYKARFSPDGGRVVTAGEDGTARIWRTRDGAPLAVLGPLNTPVREAHFSPDGTRVIALDNEPLNNTIHLWDAATGVPLAAWPTRHGVSLFNGFAFSPDGTRIVTAGFDRLARVWDVATGRQLAELRGHGETVQSAAFSPDGRWVVTSSTNEKTARVWQADTGRPVAELRLPNTASPWDATFTADGSRLVVAGSGAETLAVFMCDVCVPLDQLVTLARTRVSRALTCEERRTFLHVTADCPPTGTPSGNGR